MTSVHAHVAKGGARHVQADGHELAGTPRGEPSLLPVPLVHFVAQVVRGHKRCSELSEQRQSTVLVSGI